MTDAVIRNSANITQKLPTDCSVHKLYTLKVQILHHMHNYKLGNYSVQYIHVWYTGGVEEFMSREK